ncbi:MAG: UDP-N-acetylmuramate dehydrogenase [Firmicutes bacterium]|nr:UDP-N-acetylmuramate dehydrogenase [Bacillota bacterium]
MDIKSLKNLRCTVYENEPLYKYTTFKIGGPADFLVKVSDIESLKKILLFLSTKNIPYFLIGNGSNLLISDKGFRGVVIKLSDDFDKIFCKNNELICGASASLSKICKFALKNSLSGLEFIYGVPGACGGAVFMNAGAYGGEIKDVIKEVNYIDNMGNSGKLNKEESDFSYRSSIYSKKNLIITSATFSLVSSNFKNINKKMDENISRRNEKQPVEMASAGSVFKRPLNHFAGTLIQNCNLKGKKIGGAMVSEKHSGFIVNTGDATYEDVLNLINFIKKEVFEKTGIVLSEEIKIIGEKNGKDG